MIVKHNEAADLLMSVAFGNRVEIWGDMANLGRGSVQIGSIYKRICYLSERQATACNLLNWVNNLEGEKWIGAIITVFFSGRYCISPLILLFLDIIALL
jgi:hypothetical protein